MKNSVLVSLIAIALAGFVTLGVAGGPASSTVSMAASPADVSPRIEVAFVLDTTSSMSGLIEGAKRKIWTIARQVASGRPSPAIKLGLVGFRDLGDEYVTRAFDMTNDVDAIYGHLMAFRAVGGGDIPESVNQALYEAVTKLSWSRDPSTLKIVFLVGDAPPHMDYPDEMRYPQILQLAKRAGIIINTIQCGGNALATPFWREIAAMGAKKRCMIRLGRGWAADGQLPWVRGTRR